MANSRWQDEERQLRELMQGATQEVAGVIDGILKALLSDSNQNQLVSALKALQAVKDTLPAQEMLKVTQAQTVGVGALKKMILENNKLASTVPAPMKVDRAAGLAYLKGQEAVADGMYQAIADKRLQRGPAVKSEIRPGKK